MDECSSALGGEGGGHDIAAGARIPKDKKQEFLALIDETLKKQRGK
jgi:RecJ-like exonuclease